MNIPDFIGEDIMQLVASDNNWVTRPLLDKKKCNEYEFDASFFDDRDRVKNKYMKEVAGFMDFYSMSLQDLSKIVNPPTESRTVILGSTEYLSPYVAYCLKFISENRLDIESGNRGVLPFIFFAPIQWSENENINFIDCLSYYYKNTDKLSTIHILISKNKTSWLTPGRQPRITILELMRLYNNLGNIEIRIEDDTFNPNTYKVVITNNILGNGQKMKKNRNMRIKIYKKSRKSRKSIFKRKTKKRKHR